MLFEDQRSLADKGLGIEKRRPAVEESAGQKAEA